MRAPGQQRLELSFAGWLLAGATHNRQRGGPMA
jgi:hypothetical protein